MDFKKLFSDVSFFLKANSPGILFGAGIIGSISGTVLACLETSKLPDKKKEFQKKLEKIHAKNLDEKELKKALTKEFTQFGFEILKLYFPALVVESLSIASLFGSNKILKKRSMRAAAAYATLLAAFKDYRKEVAKKIGEEDEKKIAYSIDKDDEVTDGIKKEKINSHSPFAVIFDEYNPNWSKDYQTRKFFLLSIQNYMNDKLKARGYLFLNEVYRELGFPETKAGQAYGWLWRPDDPTYPGDGFVDFGLFNLSDPMKNEFINGYEPGVILDFNVDGDILQLKYTKDDARIRMR